VARDPPSFAEYLDRLAGNAYVDEFADQAVRGGIPMAIDLDVIIGCDAATLPARQRRRADPAVLQLGTIDLGEQFGPARAETAHLAGVEFDDEPADGDIKFR
jgi:hypothetical protein